MIAVHIVVSNNRTLLIEINEWCPFNDRHGVTEICLAILNKDQREACVNALQYHSINANLLENGLILLDKPNIFRFDAKENTLFLNYS